MEASFSTHKPYSEREVAQEARVFPEKDKVNDRGNVISPDKMNHTQQQENFF